MKKIIVILSFAIFSGSIMASKMEDQVIVRFNDSTVDILNLSNLKGSGLNSLLQLKRNACYRGNQISVIDSLNDIFNMAERSTVTINWPIIFSQATTPNIPEQNAGLGDSIGIEYEVMSGNHSIVRFTINRCK